jgi:hypothetical protein
MTPTCGFALKLNGKSRTNEAGESLLVTVQLNSIPYEPIVFAVGVSDATEATVSPTIISLGPGNALSGVHINVTGRSDHLIDGDVPYLLAVVK